MVRVPCDVGAPILFSCPRAGVCCCSHAGNAVFSSPPHRVALAEGKGHLGGGLLFTWEGAHDFSLGSLRGQAGGRAGPCTSGACRGCGSIGIVHGAGLWGHVSCWCWLWGGVGCCLLQAHCSWLCSTQSALLAELFLEDGDGAVSLQSRRSSGPWLPGRPSRRSLPSSQRSKKSISSQVQDGGALSPALSWGTPPCALPAGLDHLPVVLRSSEPP